MPRVGHDRKCEYSSGGINVSVRAIGPCVKEHSPIRQAQGRQDDAPRGRTARSGCATKARSGAGRRKRAKEELRPALRSTALSSSAKERGT